MTIRELNLSLVYPKEGQPRQVFDEDKLQELADSIEENGLIVPILVRAMEDVTYEIVHGERRWRAHKILGLETIRAEITEDVDDKTAYVLSVVENEQREDLSSIETAQALKHMIDEENLSQGLVAKRIGRSRTWVTQKLRLLGLSDKVQSEIRDGNLTESHARQILKLKDEEKREVIAERAAAENWTVQRLESEVNVILAGDAEPNEAPDKITGIAGRLANELSPKELRELAALLIAIAENT